jgi:cyclic pyranopterin phosphate synthase
MKFALTRGVLMTEAHFSHIDATGKLRMVDVSNKRSTKRQAMARCLVVTAAGLDELEPWVEGIDPLHAARVAGVHAAKRTSDLIPLCHSLNLNDVDVQLNENEDGLEISATVSATQRTGVEMEALTACAVCALSLLKALVEVDPAASIEQLSLWHKSGGRSGEWNLTSLEGWSRACPPAAVADSIVDMGPPP